MILPEFNKPLPANEKRLILGQPTQQLFPLKYPWMREYYKLAKLNAWEPEDINMTQDAYDYKHALTDEERKMYDWCLSMLTTQDLVVLGNLEEGIERHLTCPEASLYLARQTSEEAIHTDSYQYLIESLSFNENLVYERYLREESLYAKVEYAYGFHRKLMELRMTDHKNFKAIGDFITYIAFWCLGMEGGWFYSGFNWVYALRRRGLMPGTAEMFAYIQRDEHMHMRFWIDVINTLIEEYPEAYTLDVQERIVSTIRDVVYLESAFAFDMCHNVIGITAKDYMDHFRHRMNLGLNNIGIERPFTVDAKPMDWVSEFEMKRESNFFEQKVTEYQKKSSLDWGSDDEDSFGSVM